MSQTVPTGSRTTRKRKVSDLDMFQPLGEGSGTCGPGSKKIKQEKAGAKTTKNQRKRTSRCRIMGKFLRRKADPPRKLKLCDLPLLVIRRILQFIPVDDFERLAETNLFFFTLICSDRKTSADIPFKENDLKKMQKEKIIFRNPF